MKVDDANNAFGSLKENLGTTEKSPAEKQWSDVVKKVEEGSAPAGEASYNDKNAEAFQSLSSKWKLILGG